MHAAYALVLVFGLAPPDFEREVVPILAAKCLGCHNKNDASGDLSLQSFEGLAEIVPAGAPETGDLFGRIHKGDMPPKGKGKPLTDQEKGTLLSWIRAGAYWPKGRKLGLYEKTSATLGGLDWWSLQPVKRSAVPATGGATNPVDAFVRGMLAAKKMTPAVSFRQACLNPTP